MKEKISVAKDFLFENVLSVASEYGKELGKEAISEFALSQATEMGANVLVEMGGSMIPGIGGAVSSYRTNKKIKNLDILMKEISKNVDVLKERFEEQNDENKVILDEIFNMVVDKTAQLHQQEKIEYIVHGYLKLLEIENPSFDTAYLYFDTLDKLTILDISVLKLSYNTITLDQIDGHQSYTDILDSFDIDYNQYLAVRENLNRLGLMENEYDEKLVRDLKTIQIAVEEIRSTTESIVNVLSGKRSAKIKKLTSKSNIKYKAKDRLKISKFGRDFIRFFISVN